MQSDVGGRRRLAPAVLLIAFAACWMLAIASPASAHALLRTSDPAAGSSLATSPSQILCTFTEAPDPKLSSLQLLDSTGRVMSTQPAQQVPGNPEQLRLSIPALPQGAYTVVWRTVSQVDGHVTGSSFSFGVGVPAAPPARSTQPKEPPVRPLAVAGSWALAWGLVILFGAGVAGSAVTSRVERGHRALVAGAAVLAAAGLVALTFSERSAVGVSLRTLLGSAAGQDLVREGAGLLVALAAATVVLVRANNRSLILLAGGSAVAMLALSVSGHAAGESPQWLNESVQVVHLAAVGAWVGGLAWLLLAIRGADSKDRRAAVRRFSALAGFALAVTVLTGLGRAWAELGGFGPLFSTSFGVTLLVKSGLVAVLIALGALNRLRNIPRMEDATSPGIAAVRRTVRWEVVVGVAILIATAVLSELPPGAYVAATRSRSATPASVTVSGSNFGTSVKVRLTVTPGTVGSNGFVARVVDFDTGAPVKARSVTLRFSLPSHPELGSSTLPLIRGSNGTWSAQGSQLSIDGTWDVAVVVQEAASAVEVPLKVRTRLPPEQIQVSRVPGQPTLYTITLPVGGTLQTYVDPGRAGPNQVHFTFFTASGSEQPITSATAVSTDPSGTNAALALIRFDAGHFVSNVPLTAGSWTFRIDAITNLGRAVTAYFSQTIGGAS